MQILTHKVFLQCSRWDSSWLHPIKVGIVSVVVVCCPENISASPRKCLENKTQTTSLAIDNEPSSVVTTTRRKAILTSKTVWFEVKISKRLSTLCDGQRHVFSRCWATHWLTCSSGQRPSRVCSEDTSCLYAVGLSASLEDWQRQRNGMEPVQVWNWNPPHNVIFLGWFAMHFLILVSFFFCPLTRELSWERWWLVKCHVDDGNVTTLTNVLKWKIYLDVPGRTM